MLPPSIMRLPVATSRTIQGWLTYVGCEPWVPGSSCWYATCAARTGIIVGAGMITALASSPKSSLELRGAGIARRRQARAFRPAMLMLMLMRQRADGGKRRRQRTSWPW
jgi:hypothetical protein